MRFGGLKAVDGVSLYSALAVADRVCVFETGKVVFGSEAAAIKKDPAILTRFLGVH